MTHGQVKRAKRSNGEGSEFTTKDRQGRTLYVYAETVSLNNLDQPVSIRGQSLVSMAEAKKRQRLNYIRRQVKAGQMPVEALALEEQKKLRTLDQWFHEWIEKRQRGTDPLAEATYNLYKTRYRLHIGPYLGHLPLRKITPQKVDELFSTTLPAKRKKDGKTQLLQGTVLKNIYVNLWSMLDDAADLRLIDYNPVKAVVSPRRTDPNTEKRKQIATLKNWVPQHLTRVVEGSDDEARWLLALFAVRGGEALGMCLDQINWGRNKSKATILIDRQLDRHVKQHGCGTNPDGSWKCGKQSDRCPKGFGESGLYIKRKTKTRSSTREIPLVEPLYSAMKRQVEWVEKLHQSPAFTPLPGPDMDNLLFPQANGHPRRHQNDITAWKGLLDEAGVPKELRRHDARALSISMLMSGLLGVVPTPEEIMMWTGWSPATYAEMVKIYSQQTPSRISPLLSSYGEKLSERRKKEEQKSD